MQSGLAVAVAVAVEANGSAPLGVGRSQAVLVRAEAFTSRAGAVQVINGLGWAGAGLARWGGQGAAKGYLQAEAEAEAEADRRA
jgi:hypothetical protein